MAEPLLEVKNLKKYFPVKQTKLLQKRGEVRAVDNVSFHMEQGEILGLVGESGSGKTTVGKTVLNLLTPTGGSVRFEGQTLFDVEAGVHLGKREMVQMRKNMQMVFQDPYASLDPRMNVERIITEGIVKFGTVPRRELHERAEALIQECGLEPSSLKKFPHQLAAVSASASASPVPSLWSPSWWCATSPRRPWTCPSSPRSSTSCWP